MKKIAALLLILSIGVSYTFSAGADDEKIEYRPFIHGYEDSTFRPNNHVTRAEAASMIAGFTEEKEGAIAFSDVSSDMWYASSIQKLAANGFLKDYDNNFLPDKDITRIEFSELIYFLINGTDNDVSGEDAFINLVATGVIKGTGDGYYGGEDLLTRAEAVTLLNRAVGVEASYKTITGLNKRVFSDINSDFWGFYNIITAAVEARNLVTYPTKIPDDVNTKVFDKYNKKGNEWERIPMVSQELLDKGIKGGEGGQRIMSLAISSDDQLMFAGHDTGVLDRSFDGGKTWGKVLNGFNAGGCSAVAIDPYNKNHVIAVGNTQRNDQWGTSAPNGLYLSRNSGDTWNYTLSQPGAFYWFGFTESVAFDPASYDEKSGECKVAYWSRVWYAQATGYAGRKYNDEDIIKTDKDIKGLWKTTDGGDTWTVANTDMTDGTVKVDYKDGTVYVGNYDGLFRSTDGGVTFKPCLNGEAIFGLDVISTKPGVVYANDSVSVLVSEDSGNTFKRISSKNFPETAEKNVQDKMVRALKVSPVNPKNMVIASYDGSNYNCIGYYSNDGGTSWNKTGYDSKYDFFVKNGRHQIYAWSNIDETKVFSTEADWVCMSEDSGKTFCWNYNGGLGVHVDQRTIFNLYNPDLYYFGSQDFHGAMTTDGGNVWKHIWKFDGVYSGYIFGSYAIDENRLIAIKDNHQYREIIVSSDGGETWTYTGNKIEKNIEKKWTELGYQSPNNPDIVFLAYYRSEDRGDTWEELNGVNAVYCHNPYGKKELYGSDNKTIKVSYDDGETWQDYCTLLEQTVVPQDQIEIWDIDYDGVNNILYYILGNSDSGEFLCKVQNGETTVLQKFSETGNRFQTLAVDPRYPNVIYYGGYNVLQTNAGAVMRSVDGGESFQILSDTSPDTIAPGNYSGGYNPVDMIVHPETGYLWVTQSVAGLCKIAPPYEN